MNLSINKDKRYQVQWAKWIDPYGEDINEIEWPGWNENPNNADMFDDIDDMMKGMDGDNEFIGVNDDEDNIQEDPLAEDKKRMFANKPLKIITTPMGLVPLTEYTIPSKIFNFWVGHTNFTITDAVAEIIDEAEGVETLDIFTRYRLRIGIGHVFDSQLVKYNIEQLLYKHLTPEKQEKIDE